MLRDFTPAELPVEQFRPQHPTKSFTLIDDIPHAENRTAADMAASRFCGTFKSRAFTAMGSDIPARGDAWGSHPDR